MKSSMCSPMWCSLTAAALLSTAAWKKWSHAIWKSLCIPRKSRQHGPSSPYRSARGWAAASCSSRVRIASNSPASAKCARPAFLTCSLPLWAITWATHKERLDEYPIEHHARVFRPIPGNRVAGHFGSPAFLLVGAARIVGDPLDLYCAIGSRGGNPGGIPDQHDSSSSQDACCVSAKPGAAKPGDPTALHVR